MKAQIFVGLLLLSSLAVSFAHEGHHHHHHDHDHDHDHDHEHEHVLTLTTENFDETVAKFDHILVEFYAPWCGHCKRLAPEYEKAAARLAVEEPTLALAKVDVTEQRELGDRFEIRGFPTLKFFRKGVPSEYNGGRTEETIVSWMKKKTGPPAKTVSAVEQVETLAESNEVIVIGFFDEASAEQKTVFEDVAAANDDTPFILSGSADIAAKYAVSAPAVVLLKKFDEGRNDFTDAYDKETLTSWVATNSLKTVMDFDQKTAQKLFGGQQTPIVLAIRNPDTEAGKQAEAALREAATVLKGRVFLVVSGVAGPLEKRLTSFIGVPEDTEATIRLVKPTDSGLTKYMLEGEITTESIKSFVDAFFAKSLKPHLKSEPVPETQEGPVTVLVGKSFKDIALDPTKDVLVEFYAPWCGHCKKLEPIYNELAEKLKDAKNIVIAKMDSTLNEVEEVSIRGFPTIKFFPATAEKTPVDYEGARTLEGFVEFLEKNAVNSLKGEAAAAPADEPIKHDDF